jgi:hypothetical protein
MLLLLMRVVVVVRGRVGMGVGLLLLLWVGPPPVRRKLPLVSGPAVKHGLAAGGRAAGVAVAALLRLRRAVAVLAVPLGLCDGVSKRDVVLRVVVLAQAHLQRVVRLALEHDRADVVARRVGLARAALAANVHRVAQVPAGRAVAHVVVGLVGVVVVVPAVVGHDVVGLGGAAGAAVVGGMGLLGRGGLRAQAWHSESNGSTFSRKK